MLRLLLLPAVLASSFFTTVSASAIPRDIDLERRAPGAMTLAIPSSSLQDPMAINPAVKLKHVILGVGYQNYTCAKAPNSDSAPATNGAVASLYDVSQFLQTMPSFVGTLPALALGLWTMTGKDVNAITGGRGQAGKHFFNGAGQPTFDLTALNERFTGKLLASVPAPADACPGPNKAGAVNWLQLTDVGSGASYGGSNYVYRVETAGGKAPATCKGQTGDVLVPYAAEYWFYGP